MATRYTIEDIASHTGAKVELLRSFYHDLKPIFEPFSSRGDKNRLYFDASGFKVFEQAYQMKTQQGLTRAEIKNKLTEELLNSNKTDTKTHPNSDKAETIPLFILEKLEEANNKVFEAERRSYQAQLEAKEQIINSLKGSLNLLTDGRSLEEVRKEAEAKKKRKTEILDRLEELENKWFKRQEKVVLLQELRELD
jgi:hypothetical protein